MVGFSLELVVALLWDRWSPSLGTGGRFASEYALEAVTASRFAAAHLSRQGQGIDDTIQLQTVASKNRALKSGVVDHLCDRGLAEEKPEGLEISHAKGVD